MMLLDLFSGIGAFSLGLERAGFRTVAFCEADPFCRRVLAKHWPEVPCYDDVRSLTAERLRADGIAVDAICGGFPCQDISSAGTKTGITGQRSGLWREFARLIGDLGPRYVIVENVADLLTRGLGNLLGDLASLGYNAEWHCIPAAAIGAPHVRDRVWIIAYTDRGRQPTLPFNAEISGFPPGGVSDADGTRPRQSVRPSAPILCRKKMEFAGLDGGERHPWFTEPGMARVADGIANRSHRIAAIGNSLVPQIPELIGRAIMAREAAA